ncbi:hypothetical protein GCM10009612_75930 [Streptomyces beijiangensis]
MKPKPFSALNHLTVPLAMCPPRGLEVASRTLREPEVVVLVLRDAEQQAARELASTGGTSEPRLLVWTLHGPVRSKLRITGNALSKASASVGALENVTLTAIP